ncbi:hypothetical protein CPY51_16755 [Rhizobium tubonense]|uniref:YjiS-like domain-containing protein n=2 Tax=Rhizobium tubonense TaxID=484088 RepID=A0A2W4EPS4_9HYPH|nr:hypothetical protein CPY51_16755 [Rhizobium tubonense]
MSSDEEHLRLSGSIGVAGWKSMRAIASWLLEEARIWASKRASRKVLRDLTDGELLDIGLTRSEANREVNRSFFWD